MRAILLWFMLSLSACVPKGDLDSAQSENAKLKAQVEQLQQQVADLQKRLSESSSQLTNAQAELARMPQMPVKVTFRKAMTGPGMVAMFETTVKQDIPVVVTHYNKALAMPQQFRLNLSQTRQSPLGYAEGAPLEIGEELLVENNNYEPLKVLVTQ